ncbi:hypothetical protein [Pacificibacter marinus]|nr:hypothetical protein [Pacificibacter marinus]
MNTLIRAFLSNVVPRAPMMLLIYCLGICEYCVSVGPYTVLFA